MDWEAIEGIVYSEEDHPENILGPHKIRGGFLVQTFIPGAQEVTLQLRKSGKTIAMELADEAGFFAAILPEKKPVSYFYNVVYDNGDSEQREDPYLYPDLLGANELKRFESGIHYSVYDYLGSHTMAVYGCGSQAESEWDVRTVKKDGVFGTHLQCGHRMPCVSVLWGILIIGTAECTRCAASAIPAYLPCLFREWIRERSTNTRSRLIIRPFY